ncbi:hypothetical protein BU15DRAFT_76136 [Melanogaster broomeanus]|nr:hypothetical protein BU15DRAFT_76136 [Melanogaster broomeanus]
MSLTIPEFAELQTSKASLHYFNGAGIAILVFDYLITIEDEARWVWGREWDTTRLIFTVSRYIPFLGTGLTAYHIPFNSSSAPCLSSLETLAIGIIAAEYSSEVLLVLRTYALWLGDKRLLYGLLAYGAVGICAGFVIDLSPKQLLPGAQPQIGCLLESRKNVALVYAIFWLYEIVIFALIAYKSFDASRGTRSTIVRKIYRDGMFYVLCIVVAGIAILVRTFSMKYYRISLMANQVFDYLITIEDEARWVWGRKWDTTRLIFTVSRYVPFLGTGLTSYYLPFDSPFAPCPSSLQATENVIHIIGVIAAELLLLLRTYAFWRGDKRVLYGLLAYAVVTICAAIAIDTSSTQFLPGGKYKSVLELLCLLTRL